MPYRKATIRAARPEDRSILFSLARETFGGRESWSDDAALQALERDTVFVADVGEDAAGYVALQPGGDAVVIEHFLVSPHHEHEGVGRQLLEYVEGFAIAARATSLRIVAEEDNSTAVAFYRRYGFAQAGSAVWELQLPRA